MTGRQNRPHVRTSVDFYQPNSQVFIKDEVEAHNLELGARPFPEVELGDWGQMTVDHDIFHSLKDMVFVQVSEVIQVILIQVLKEARIRNLVALFMLLILVRLHLEAVVRQVNELALVTQGVVVGTCPQVARLVKEKVFVVVDKTQHSNVKLPSVIEQRPLYVLLDNKVFPWDFTAHLWYEVLVGTDQLYPSPPVFILWL